MLPALTSSAKQHTFLLYFFLLYCCWLMCVVRAEMHCLVIRPGFGLVSELCPPHTVACRIRIEKDAVSFYEYSPLYDRNQFVCVLKGEFGVQFGSGCVRKRSGHIRCWCYGRSNCNSPENSKLLYGTFLTGDEAKFLDTIHQLDFEELREKEDAWAQNGNTFSTNGATRATTEITKIVQKLTKSTPTPTIAISGKGTKGHQNAPFSPPPPPRQSAAKIVNSSEPLPLGKQEVGKAIPTQLPPVNETEINYGQRLGQKNMTAKGHNSSQIKTGENKGKAAANQQNMGAKLHPHLPIKRGNISSSSSSNDGTTNNTINGSSMRSEYDRHNRVHVIHVSARDRYEPVNLFGSMALQRIMEKERKLLQSVDEFGNSSTRDDAEGEGEEEEEELEEDWEWPIRMEEEETEGEDNHQSKQFQQPKRMAESGGPKQQKNKPNHSVHKIRLEQRQRSPSASKETEEEEELEEGENAIGQEYFDNTFIGPSSSSSFAIFPSSSSFILSISFIILHLHLFVFFTLG